MRLYILNQKYRFIIVLLLGVLLTGSINAQVKTEVSANTVTVKLKIVDDEGNPIPKSIVAIGDGVTSEETDENGILSINASPNDLITVTSSGYETNVFLVQDILANSTIKLSKSKLYMSLDDDVQLPFLTLKKRFEPGNSNVLRSEQLEKYPSTDLRNALTGLGTGVEVLELNGQPGLAAEEKMGTYKITDKLQITARGHSMIYIIDGMPTDITEMPLDPDEIESLTMIKDVVGKAMYGPAGANGIILIKTKRGHQNERLMKMNYEEGVGVIDRFPEWTSGADYAQLNDQARINDGLNPNYTDAIPYYAKNDPYDMYYPSVNFKELMLKNARSFRRANISSSGGNNRIQYAAYVGYAYDGDIYEIGPKANYNRINARSNVDVRVTDFMNLKFDLFAGLSYRRSANYKYSTSEADANMDLIEFNSVIKDITSVPPIAFPVYANNDPSLTQPWYAVSNAYKDNPIGDLVEDGYYTESGRNASGNVTMDFDLKGIIKGLKSESKVIFSLYDQLRIGKAEYYSAYIVTPAEDNSSYDLTFVHDGISTSDLTNLHDYFTQRFVFYENLNYNRSFGKHGIQSALTYYLTTATINGIKDPQRQQDVVWTGIYSFNNKYIVQGVLNYAGSSSFAENMRFELFPSAGASWVISEESFMTNLKFINYLKFGAEAGILGYNNFLPPYNYRSNWSRSLGAAFGAYSTNQWFGSAKDNSVYRTIPTRIGNPDLSYEKRKEFSIGIDALMFNQKLSFEANYYNILSEGEITQPTNTLPYVAGISSTLPLFNYNETRYFGLETGIQFTNSIEKIKYSIGAKATIQNSKYVKFEEPDYRYAYQVHTGTATDTYWGQTYLGKFKSDEEALEIPQLFDEVLHQGDLKYQDMNNDNVVDDNDQSAQGHTTPRLFYALSAYLSYKNFDITLIGTGRAFYDIPLTNRYYWNGWGDNNYSNFVKDNIGEAYPRLTYYKVNNNFVNSNFWLTKGDYFKIQNIELGYNLSPNTLKILSGGQGIRFYIRGSNLLTISKVKDVDPESINSGVEVYPLYKTFSGGVKLTF